MDNSNEIKMFRPPSWMGRAEKQLFNRVQKLRNARNSPLDETEVPLLIDYVAAKSRIDVLRLALWDDDQRMRRTKGDASVKRRLLATARQIDATTKLAMELWEKLAADQA